MKKVLIFSFFCSLFLTVSFAQKVKPVNYGGSVNLIEVRGRGYDAVLVFVRWVTVKTMLWRRKMRRCV